MPLRRSAALLVTTLTAGLLTLPGASAHAAQGEVNFTGYGFDQCLAPTQSAMEAWRLHSPFLAVGIYISGDSRACRSQPNLTPAWVDTQTRKGWRLLPITLGPQASCSTRFPRYGSDETINPDPTSRYLKARRQGVAEAMKTVRAADALGIGRRTTQWYDLEGFDSTRLHCRESALAFLHAWTNRMRALDRIPGVYSSAGSGIKMLDDVRRFRPRAWNVPDQIWIARWDGLANTSTSYISEAGWRPGGRMKQYRGGHLETWGGVTINIDSNWLDLGRTTGVRENHCGGTVLSYPRYYPLYRGVDRPRQTKALQCMLSERGLYSGAINGDYTWRTRQAVLAWQERRGLARSSRFSARHWQILHATGPSPVIKMGVATPVVRRLERSLNAAGAGTRINGIFDPATERALKSWQRAVGLPATGVMTTRAWQVLKTGRS